MPRRTRLAAIAAAVALAGCSNVTTMRAPSVRESGFLGDYSRLKPAPEGQALLVYVADGANLAPYPQLLLDRVAVWGSAAAADVPPAEMQHLADLLYGQLRATLGTYYVISDAPGPGVLRIRAALTEATPADRALNIWSNVGLVGRAVNEVSRTATGTNAFVGAASAECEVLDSQTGKVFVAAVDRRVGTRTLTDANDPWEVVEASFQLWAQRLLTRLQSLGGPQRPVPYWAQPPQ